MSDEAEAEPRHLRSTSWVRALLGPPPPLEPRWRNLAGYTAWKFTSLAHLSAWRWWVWFAAFLGSGVTGLWDRDLPAVVVFLRSAAVAVLLFFLPYAFDGLQMTVRDWWRRRKQP